MSQQVNYIQHVYIFKALSDQPGHFSKINTHKTEKKNIIEQVTDFKYLGYPISEFKSDLEDKLQTSNKQKKK